MQQLAQKLADLLGITSPWLRDGLYLGFILLVALVVISVAFTIAGIMTVAERRVAGRMQSRVGPNRVGPLGLLQWAADGVKLLLKEDIVPREVDRPLFLLAPYPVMVGVLAAFVSLPFGQLLIAADLNVGFLYLVAITSLVVVGILMAGWGSNNKWSLFGGIRSAAQIVAYEVPSVMAAMSVVIIAGSLSLQSIIRGQGGWPYEWYVFHNPFAFVAFFLYFTAALAEGNRTPFDLPEAESELVSGYNTEYSGMRFAAFFLAEFANVYVMAAIATSLFFGGWQLPGVTPAEQQAVWWLQLCGLAVFVVKAAFWSFVVIWLRWTLPRLRVDQLTSLCYRYLLPLSFVALAGNAVYVWLVPEGSLVHAIVRGVMAGVGAALCLLLVWRVFYHIRHVGDRISIDLSRGERGAFEPRLQVRGYGAFRRRIKAT